MKPIETEFDGYKFRSRLEARWAVFFHVAGIPYEYEQEGFELPSGSYLPDFYLPWFNCYVEIKPNDSDAIEKGERCCRELRDNLEDKITMLCIGQPCENNIRLYGYTYDNSGGGPDEYDRAYFLEGVWWGENGESLSGMTKHWINIVINEERIDRYFCAQNGDSCEVKSIFRDGRHYEDDEYTLLVITEWRSELDHAKRVAKQARFEHGANPLDGERNYDYEHKPLDYSFSWFLKKSIKEHYDGKPCPICGGHDIFACHELEDDGTPYYQYGCFQCNRYYVGDDCQEKWNHRKTDGSFAEEIPPNAEEEMEQWLKETGQIS